MTGAAPDVMPPATIKVLVTGPYNAGKTTLGLGQRVAQSLIGPGEFREAVTRSGGGYFVVYAAGRNAVLAVLAPDSLNVGRLHFEARRTTARIADLVAARSTAR